jgi:PilZ domain
MACARAVLERRRSSRVQTKIPVRIVANGDDGQSRDGAAETLSVSRHGALIRVPFLPPMGSRIELQHGLSNEKREFRVISSRGGEEHGPFELGVEIYYPARNFWGVHFPDERHPVA